ncbi:hypothetical protein G8C92_06550 [Paenibacillus donghaensis]|uniref:hypothetical protein n=1 Tax=Paenibacillus donghaensis TaxID=414771 RepID=UPI001883D4F3|nr:hypothetical protein [Paenibacillus donghaensis]MBE9913690.1 hypothetical protein [Paenibacillus donghaensis]
MVYDCDRCTQIYTLYTIEYCDKGIASTSFGWVTRTSLKRNEELKKHLSEAQEKLLVIARSRYLDLWLNYFSEAKSKKAVWGMLSKLFGQETSLSTFYSNSKNLTAYLDNYFNFNNYGKIISVLNIDDADLEQQMVVFTELNQQLEESNYQLYKEKFK